VVYIVTTGGRGGIILRNSVDAGRGKGGAETRGGFKESGLTRYCFVYGLFVHESIRGVSPREKTRPPLDLYKILFCLWAFCARINRVNLG